MATIAVHTTEPVLTVDGIKYRHHANGGGLVAETAEVAPSAYVGPFAQVRDQAKVLDNAVVDGFAHVFDQAKVYDQAHVYGYTRVFCDAEVCGQAEVYGGIMLFQGVVSEGVRH